MLGAEHSFADRQGAFEEGPRGGELALVPQQEGEVVQANRGLRVFGAERLLLDRQGALALAGLWETWRSPAGERVRSFAIITTTPNEMCAELHNRMPVILNSYKWPVWLGEEMADPHQLKDLLAPYPTEEMIAWPATPRVGNVKNNDESLIEPVTVTAG
jgi:hypothetical protein